LPASETASYVRCAGLSRQGFEFDEDLLNRIEAARVFRQEQRRALTARIACRTPFPYASEIVEDHDVSRLEGREEQTARHRRFEPSASSPMGSRTKMEETPNYRVHFAHTPYSNILKILHNLSSPSSGPRKSVRYRVEAWRSYRGDGRKCRQ